jgi:hypothetical protein
MRDDEGNRQLGDAANAIARALEEQNRLYARSLELYERRLALEEQNQHLRTEWAEDQKENSRLYRERLKGNRRQQRRSLVVLLVLLLVLIAGGILAAVFSDKNRGRLSIRSEPIAPPDRGGRVV